jgi:hypothetical protein
MLGVGTLLGWYVPHRRIAEFPPQASQRIDG